MVVSDSRTDHRTRRRFSRTFTICILFFIFSSRETFHVYFFNNISRDDWRAALAGNLSASRLSLNSDRLPSHAESVASAFIRAEKLKDGSFHWLDSWLRFVHFSRSQETRETPLLVEVVHGDRKLLEPASQPTASHNLFAREREEGSLYRGTCHRV